MQHLIGEVACKPVCSSSEPRLRLLRKTSRLFETEEPQRVSELLWLEMPRWDPGTYAALASAVRDVGHSPKANYSLAQWVVTWRNERTRSLRTCSRVQEHLQSPIAPHCSEFPFWTATIICVPFSMALLGWEWEKNTEWEQFSFHF